MGALGIRASQDFAINKEVPFLFSGNATQSLANNGKGGRSGETGKEKEEEEIDLFFSPLSSFYFCPISYYQGSGTQGKETPLLSQGKRVPLKCRAPPPV